MSSDREPHIFYEIVDSRFVLPYKTKTTSWIIGCLKLLFPNRHSSVTFIFCSDAYLLQMNIHFLGHDFFTDVVTFDNSIDENLSSDIFISVDRVESNAKIYSPTFYDELCRVMIHGILHLSRFDDKDDVNKALMKSEEDYYLSLRVFD